MTNKLTPNTWNFTRKYRGPISDDALIIITKFL